MSDAQTQAAEAGSADSNVASEASKQPATAVRRSQRKGNFNLYSLCNSDSSFWLFDVVGKVKKFPDDSESGTVSEKELPPETSLEEQTEDLAVEAEKAFENDETAESSDEGLLVESNEATILIDHTDLYKFMVLLFLQIDEKQNNSSSQARYECKDCSKSFHHRNDLIRHMKIHNGTKPYSCETCGKTFLRSDYLRLHVIKHQGIKPLKCDLCDRRFYDRSNLRQHMRTHTGEKPALCPYCPHRCSQLSDMRKHLTIHTKEKAFQCDTCGKMI